MTATAPPDVFEAALTLAETLERHAMPYCLGGAIAYGQYGIPRATKDVDINVFLEPDALTPLIVILQDLGLRFPADPAGDAAREGLVVAHWNGYRIDIFTPSIPFSREAERTKTYFQFDDRGAWFLAVEALCVFKLLFFRGKDLVDLERLLAVMGPQIDIAYVRHHIADMMGETDERTHAWDRLTAQWASPGNPS